MSFYNTLKEDINVIIKHKFCNNNYKKETYDAFQVNDPPSDKFGDVSTNVALALSKILKKNPKTFANDLINEIKKIEYVDSAKAEGPGFINLSLKKEFWLTELHKVLLENDKYGENKIGKSQKAIIEFVSANPTGPLHIGHCRGAVYGDTLSNIMTKSGYKVCKEFYVNDTGGQIDKLIETVIYRYLELFNKQKGAMNKDLYPGEYVVSLAKDLKKKYGSKLLVPNKKDFDIIRSFSINWILDLIKSDLKSLGVKFDFFFSEQKLLKKDKVRISVDQLKKKKLIYHGFPTKPKSGDVGEWEPRKQFLFKSTDFGDDTDRALQKSNGDYTYFAKDIAYHFDKFKRGFVLMINVWGADHGGYIKRLTGAVNALTKNKSNLIIKICQLVKVVKNKKNLKMSKREGKYISLKDVLESVGRDVTRFIMLLRRNNEDIEFDLEKVTEESKDNPVFYVQYAHARCCSVLREASKYFNANNLKIEKIRKVDTSLIIEKQELSLIQDIVKLPKIIEDAAIHQEPHRITFYLQSLSSKFHSLWNYGKQNTNLRFIDEKNKDLTLARLAMIYALKIVLNNGLNLLGVKPLEIMK